MPVAVLAAFIDAICARSSAPLHRHMLPSPAIGELRENLHVDRYAGMLHARRCSDDFATIERDVEIDVRQQPRQQPHHGIDVAVGIAQNVGTLFGRERPAFNDTVTHSVLVLATDAVEIEEGERAEQALAFRHGAAVHVAAEFRVRSSTLTGSGQPSARWQLSSALPTKQTKACLVVYRIRRRRRARRAISAGSARTAIHAMPGRPRRVALPVGRQTRSRQRRCADSH